MMASPALTYASPSDGRHTPIGSPAPSQILLQRVASPNHLGQHAYIESPRSIPDNFHYSAAPEQQFDYEQNSEMYVNEDPHIYDFGPNGALPADTQFVQQQVPSQGDISHVPMFLVSFIHFPR